MYYISQFTTNICHIDGTKNEMADMFVKPFFSALPSHKESNLLLWLLNNGKTVIQAMCQVAVSNLRTFNRPPGRAPSSVMCRLLFIALSDPPLFVKLCFTLFMDYPTLGSEPQKSPRGKVRLAWYEQGRQSLGTVVSELSAEKV
ncbi:unnamed protein product [Schistocephalus solidus]|uniref:Uncharacterized protein n=1 Tax=Schistocephalus solidus TaxID=70667 RepID=A0A3P7CG40_SCHSO|nr:unnamed protein product [Schistocephalus solidus]